MALFGDQDEKIFVEISQRRLSQLGLDMNQVLSQLNQQNAVEGAGTVQTPLDIVQVRVGDQFRSLEQLRAMPIRSSSGNQIRLSDIAEVKRGTLDPPEVLLRHQGRRVIALGVWMAKGGDIIGLGKALKDATRRIDARLPAGMKLVASRWRARSRKAARVRRRSWRACRSCCSSPSPC